MLSIYDDDPNSYRGDLPLQYSDDVLTEPVPVAEAGAVTGRVVDQAGNGVRNAVVTLTHQPNGWSMTAQTSPFGIYTFSAVPFGSYTAHVSSRLHRVAPQLVTVNGSETVDFIAADDAACPPGLIMSADGQCVQPPPPPINDDGEPLVCPPGQRPVRQADGSYVCETVYRTQDDDDDGGGDEPAIGPGPPVTRPPAPSILDGVIDAQGNIFGYSPLLVASVAAGVLFLMSGSRK